MVVPPSRCRAEEDGATSGNGVHWQRRQLKAAGRTTPASEWHGTSGEATTGGARHRRRKRGPSGPDASGNDDGR
ncbi:hypothetical protein E2562_032594 [Oryza meyeriana var. granulata]|uniref:Uncharacterized protein n=1 Tax=Oryza meyeriana var. granulata TaxID=110450 RepID=A0A6G1EC33_9ORYZ|nr:hypothetical protein E2562_032594 [Oryza meyeriana var. granulata]